MSLWFTGVNEGYIHWWQNGIPFCLLTRMPAWPDWNQRILLKHIRLFIEATGRKKKPEGTLTRDSYWALPFRE